MTAIDHGSALVCKFANQEVTAYAEDLMNLALIAAQGLYSESSLRLKARYSCRLSTCQIKIKSGTTEGDCVGQIFLSLLDRALEPDQYELCSQSWGLQGNGVSAGAAVA